ncbi:MAG: tetratricopeptide repeat protein [Pseudomonadota bacterium]
MARVFYGKVPDATNEEAVKCFQEAIKLNPDRLIHHIELGRTYAQMGEIEDAKKCLKKGLAMPITGKDDPDAKVRGRETLNSLQ